MAAEAALLEAIYAAPDRDEPRLVYADWLQERQDPRGELIHLQIAQSKLTAKSAAWQRLGTRIDALLQASNRAWLPKLPLGPAELNEWTYTRGFPSGIYVRASWFAQHRLALFAAMPLLDDLRLECRAGSPMSLSQKFWRDLFASGRKLKTLRLMSLSDTSAVTFCGEPGVALLHGVEIGHSKLELGAWMLLGDRGSQLLGLQALSLVQSGAREAAVERLLDQPWLKLNALAISNEPIGERGVRAITDRGRLPGLTSLELSWCALGGVGAVEAIAQSTTLPGLEALDLSYSKVTDEMCAVLATSRVLKLKRLRLNHAEVTAKGITALVDAPWAGGLELLDLLGSHLDVRSQATLVARMKDRAVF